MIEKDSMLMGFVLGAITPIVGFVVIEFIFNTLTDMGWMAEVSMSTAGRRFRTLTLLAICSVLVPFQIAKVKKWDNTMRGMVFPTLIYVGAWIYQFFDELFA
ncbi:MAG: hypothetical protein J5I52_02240 [Saprospiraceae bacterium]|nr:MAG: hypothetical protein UZ09_BCD002001528 [Bacteroidetes bacterium OLB9]MCO6462947.1 hypothetical protein [Saprospiraceae bacterium]MCZ2338256.1 hypothetical protein [Chitinophagales bacterium]